MMESPPFRKKAGLCFSTMVFRQFENRPGALFPSLIWTSVIWATVMKGGFDTGADVLTEALAMAEIPSEDRPSVLMSVLLFTYSIFLLLPAEYLCQM